MLTQTLLVMTLSAAPVQFVATPVDLGNIYLKRPELLAPAVTTELTRRGLTVLTQSDAEGKLGDDKAAALFACKVPAQKCNQDLAEALTAASVSATAVLRTRISREPSDSYGVLVQAFSLADGRLLATFYEGGVEGEGGLLTVLGKGGLSLGAALASPAFEVTASTPFLQATRTSPLVRKIGWGAAAGAVVTGLFGLVSAVRRMDILNAPIADDAGDVARDRSIIYAEAEEQRVTAVAMFSVGSVAAVTAAVLLYFGFKQAPVAFELVPNANGGTLGLSGTF
jgi:hypothetical protein